jgi:uncharacterized protein
MSIDQTGCIGNTIPRATGGYFDLANPRPEDVRIEDIAIGLSNLCRYTGQIPDDRFYSVAEHSVHCVEFCKRKFPEIASRNVLKAVLLHDAAEAYCGDVSKPLKNLLLEYTDGYTKIEQKICHAIWQALDIPSGADEIIKYCDRTLLFTEKEQIFGRRDAWTDQSKYEIPYWLNLRFWSPSSARQFFMNAWREIQCPLVP